MAEQEGGLGLGLVRGLFAMVGVHLQYARREAENDVGRVVMGVFLAAVALVLLLAALLVLDAALIVLVKRRVATWLQAIALVGGANVILAAIAGLAARARLRKPVLKETRAMVQKTVSTMTEVAR